VRKRFFLLAALLFAGTAVFHVVEMARSGFTPRHLVFVGVNLVSASLCVTRPRRWFPLYLFCLTLQQGYSHGGDLIRTWQSTAKVDWTSALMIAFLPLLLALALIEEKSVRPAA